MRLRRALFLEPVPCGDISYLDWRLDDKDLYSDTHARLGLGERLRGAERDQKPKRYPSHWGKTRHDSGKYRVFVNPLLVKLFPILSAEGVYWYEQFEDLPKAAQCEHASWKSMYFTQPPVNCMALEWDSADSEAEDVGRVADWTITTIRKSPTSKGVNMQELFWRLTGLGMPA